jgi:hypothetical protein
MSFKEASGIVLWLLLGITMSVIFTLAAYEVFRLYV